MSPTITIRFVEPDDADAIQLYASEPRLHATCNLPSPYPVGGGAQFVASAIAARQEARQLVFAVIHDGAFAGLMTLNDVNQVEGTAQLDYWIGHPFWGRGIGTSAASLVIAYAFNELGLHTLFSGAMVRNPASQRVLEKNGFIKIGEHGYNGPYPDRFGAEILTRQRLLKQDWRMTTSEEALPGRTI